MATRKPPDNDQAFALLQFQLQQAQAQAAQTVQAAQYTLRSLLTDYTDHQQTLGRTSFKDAIDETFNDPRYSSVVMEF